MSVVDQRPEELIAATAMGVQVQYAAGLGPSGNSSSLRFSVESIQIDDEIPGTRSGLHSSVAIPMLSVKKRMHRACPVRRTQLGMLILSSCKARVAFATPKMRK